MIRDAGKKPVKEMKITKPELKPLIPKCEKALKEISAVLEVKLIVYYTILHFFKKLFVVKPACG